MRRRNGWLFVVVALAGILPGSSFSFAGEEAKSQTKEVSENELLATIERLGGSLQTDLPYQMRLQLNAGQLREIVARSDEFLSRFSGSSDRDKVLIAKIAALAELARTRPEYLDQLKSLTAEVAGGSPSEPLASENAFFAIHAFVIGARNEKMDSQWRLQGTMERYQVYLRDHPGSRWTPIVWVLVRNLLVQKKEDEARREVVELEKTYPEHRAAKRARGELFRATAIGKPFGFTLKSPDGKTLDTAKYTGKVLVIHFWSNTNARAVKGLAMLRALHKLHAAKGLVLIGINLDMNRTIFQQSLKRLNLPWPQYHEPRGIAGDLVVRLGVIRIPTYYVVDHEGVLRHTNPGARLPQIVEGLVANVPTER